ncbi:MAG: OmpA family protein [Flavobacteriales bacterium]
MKRLLIISLLFFSISATSVCQVFTLKDSIIHLGDVMRVTVNFNYDAMEILPESFPLLDSISTFINGQQDFGFEIGNHTDSRGDNSFNKILSEKRAQMVSQYIIYRGYIDLEQIRHVGYGEDKPLIYFDEIAKMPADKQEQAHTLNRRTEITVFCLSSKYLQDLILPKFSAKSAKLEETNLINTEFFDLKEGQECLLHSNYPIDTTFIELESWLLAHPDSRVEISVNLDERGDAKYNQIISDRKANRLKDYLASKGIKKETFAITGYGESKPLIPEKEVARMCLPADQEKAHEINRRTEIKILKI